MAQNAPGKHFRKGLSLVQLTRMFPDDATARTWVEGIRWPDGPICPHCKSDRIAHPVTHKTMTHRCRDCRKWFSVRTGTVMQSSKLDLQVWVIAVYLLNTGLKGQASMKLHRDLGITQKAAWHLAHRIRECWDKKGGLFGGPAEADESYWGGKESNKHASKKLKAGRGAVGKVPVAGVRDRATGKVAARKVEKADAFTVQSFVAEHVQIGAHLFTDESRVYSGIGAWYRHATVKHSVGEYVNGMASTNGLESFWAAMRRGFHGTYHHFSAKHLNRYVTEFAGRHNNRDADTLDMMAESFAGMIGKRLRYADLIA